MLQEVYQHRLCEIHIEPIREVVAKKIAIFAQWHVGADGLNQCFCSGSGIGYGQLVEEGSHRSLANKQNMVKIGSVVEGRSCWFALQVHNDGFDARFFAWATADICSKD